MHFFNFWQLWLNFGKLAEGQDEVGVGGRWIEVEEGERTIAETAAAVKKAADPMKIVAVIVGGESGVTLADKLSTELKVRSNGIFPFGDRRNKSVQ